MLLLKKLLANKNKNKIVFSFHRKILRVITSAIAWMYFPISIYPANYYKIKLEDMAFSGYFPLILQILTRLICWYSHKKTFNKIALVNLTFMIMELRKIIISSHFEFSMNDKLNGKHFSSVLWSFNRLLTDAYICFKWAITKDSFQAGVFCWY